MNFGQESIVAVVLGCFSTSGGPRIEITGIEEIERETRVRVLSDPQPGVGLGLSTPFHIVKVRRIKGPVTFFHARIPDWYCSAEFRCRPGSRCNLVDTTCELPETFGMCEPSRTCPGDIDPVCGCDGVTYENDCLRIQASATLQHRGACS